MARRIDPSTRCSSTEASWALIRKGFTELGVERVVASTMAANTASRRVMAKAGPRFVRTFQMEGPEVSARSEQEDVEYALTRAEWERWEAGGPDGLAGDNVHGTEPET